VRAADPTAGTLVTDAAPRFAAAWAALVYALFTMLLAYPAVTGAFLVTLRSDQYKIGYAFRQFAAEWMRAGHGFPQWNPYLYGGLPYVAAMHGDIFYPTFLLRLIMPTDAAMTWEFPIHVFLAGLFTYLFLRAWRLGFLSSVAGGLAYMLSGQVVSLASPGHDGKLFVSALLPLALLFLVRGVRDGRRWAWGGLAVAVGLAVLSPHPQLLQYMLLMCGAFALYLAFATHEGTGKLPRDVAMRRLAFALGAVVLGGLIGAIQFWPVKEYVPFSPRAGGRGYDYATSFSMPIEELVNTFIPQFSGILDHYWGRNMIHFHSEYLGAAVLVLTGAAFGPLARRGFRRFWLFSGIVALLWALGGNTPFYHIVYAIVPGAHYFRAPSTIFFLVSFAVAVLAALGVERVLAGEIGVKYCLTWVAVAVLIAIALSTGAYGAISREVTDAIGALYGPQRGAMNAAGAQANTADALLGAWRAVLVVLLTCGVIWLAFQRRFSPRVLGWALVVIVGLDLWSIERMYWGFSAPAAQLYAGDAATEYLNATSEPARVLVIPLAQLGGVAPADPMLDGCSGGTGGPTLMVHHIRNLLGCHGNELGRFQTLAGVSDTSNYDPLRFLEPAYAHHENVQYLLTNAPDSIMTLVQQQLHLAPFTRVVGPTRTAGGSTVYLYRMPGQNPLAWVATSVVKGTDEQALATVTSPGFDPARAAILDSASTLASVPIQAVGAAADVHATATHYEPGFMVIHLDRPATAGQALVVSENYYPGWQATVDGKSAPLARMNYNLIGVELPAGATVVRLRFADAAYATGRIVTVVALLLAIGLWIWGGIAERRDRVPATVRPLSPAAA
jgi:hypothetical protein